MACRIGGAYEGDFMPYLCAVDILDLMIDLSLGLALQDRKIQDYQLLDNDKWLSVQLFFARPGRIAYLSSIDELKQLPGVLQAGFNFSRGDTVGKIENATERAGYFIVSGGSRKELQENIDSCFKQIRIEDNCGKNLLIKKKGEGR
ncbi:MAG TPA: hypothetical protein VKY40_02780 [Halanaerobiales bacterium]|nr:hypothetical protein [Halanaerobiales bacterium]